MDEETWFGLVHILSEMRLAYPQQWVDEDETGVTVQRWHAILGLYDRWRQQDVPPDLTTVQALVMTWLFDNAPARVKKLIT